MTTLTAQGLISQYQHQLDAFFAAPREASAELGQLLQAHFQPEQMRQLIAAILQDDALLAVISARSYMHGNGFLKVVLLDRGYKLRLHIWFAGQSCEENIHDHRWSFASLILNGALHSEIWQDHDQGQCFEQFIYYAAQKNQAPQKHFLGTTTLKVIKHSQQKAGQSYVMPKGQLHRIINPGNELVATMMCSAPTDQGTNRLIPTRDGIDPNIQPPKMTAPQLKAALQAYLDHLNQTQQLEFSHAA